MKNRVFEIQSDRLCDESLNLLVKNCGINPETARGQKILHKCLETREKFCRNCVIKVIITPFIPEKSYDNSMKIKNKVISCSRFAEMDLNKAAGGYLYSIHVEPPEYDVMSTIQAYYADCWLNAYVEAVWHDIGTLLDNEMSKDFYSDGHDMPMSLSECYGPGFNGMEIESMADIFELMNLSEYGLKLQGRDRIFPYNSIIGMCFVIYLGIKGDDLLC